MRALRLAATVWLEVELSAALVALPIANADLALEIAWVGHLPRVAALLAFTGGFATVPLAWWARPIARAFRGWR